MIGFIIQALFFIKIQPNMNEQEKKWWRIYDLLYTSQSFFFLPYTKQRKIFFSKRAF